MFARSVTLHLDPELWPAIREFAAQVRDRLGGFPGLVSWALVADSETGNATSFSVFDDEAAFMAVNGQINEIVSEFSRFFTAPPKELLGEVLAALGSPEEVH